MLQATSYTLHEKKGFTLIELLMVIGIIAVISVAILLTLNPAEILRQSRDSSRLHDLSTIKNAIALYLADVAVPQLAGNYQRCYMSPSTGNSTTTAQCGFLFTANITSTSTAASTDYRDVDGTGWVPINFNQVVSKAPISTLPVDPVNNVTYYYAYAASTSLTFELDAARMESAKYGAGGSKDAVSTDGGNNNNAYETGTAPGFAL